jgi:hypothetical protein
MWRRRGRGEKEQLISRATLWLYARRRDRLLTSLTCMLGCTDNLFFALDRYGCKPGAVYLVNLTIEIETY